MRFDQVLVTGGAGRLGRYVVRELAGQCHVSVLDRKEQTASSVDLPVHVPPVHFPVDVLDLDALRSAMRGQHAVVHLAAIDSSVTAPPEVVFDANVRGTWNVLHAAAAAGGGWVVVWSGSAAHGRA